MKRIVLFAMAVLAFTASSVAQKYALVDMEYILKNIPSYEMANEQLNQVSQRWQKECDDKAAEAKTMYKKLSIGFGISYRGNEGKKRRGNP